MSLAAEPANSPRWFAPGSFGSTIDEGISLCYVPRMNRHYAVSHDRQEETPEAKTRWFCSLGMADRMQMLCDLTDMALSINPSLSEKKIAQPAPRRIQVVSAT